MTDKVRAHVSITIGKVTVEDRRAFVDTPEAAIADWARCTLNRLINSLVGIATEQNVVQSKRVAKKSGRGCKRNPVSEIVNTE